MYCRFNNIQFITKVLVIINQAEFENEMNYRCVKHPESQKQTLSQPKYCHCSDNMIIRPH